MTASSKHTPPARPSPAFESDPDGGPVPSAPHEPSPAGAPVANPVLGPVSGRYEGLMTAPTPGVYWLELRIDLNSTDPNRMVLNKLSGDFYQVLSFNLPGSNPASWKMYTQSWIVDDPSVQFGQTQVEIRGLLRYWKNAPGPAEIFITLPLDDGAPSQVTVTFLDASGPSSAYSCAKTTDYFRDVTLEIDVCSSKNIPPLLPAYDTRWHPTQPADLASRSLTIESAYREAGIDLKINPVHTVIDDSAPNFSSWSPSELHDVMETNFSEFPGGWPKWQLWGLLAGSFENPNVGGIMFDTASDYGGAGEAPERQGFAIFRNHGWFAQLTASDPTNADQAWAMRHFLYTWVHEAGHAFNLLHSWDKNRPDSLSWMNYDWKYDARNGSNTFWQRFKFRFDEDELIHLRHGDRSAVIMGGDPWSSGGHAENFPYLNAQTVGLPPLEFFVRSKEYFEFLEPVTLEFRLRNLLEDVEVPVDSRLNPDSGNVLVYIRRPDGRTLKYAPICCKVAEPCILSLKSPSKSIKGEDRYSEAVFLSYGKDGFYFDQPGEYLVRAVYQTPHDFVVLSNIHRIRVGNPLTKEEDCLAQDFFSYAVGMSLYLNGSRSPYLLKGMNLLEELTLRAKDSHVGAQAAIILAQSLSRPFFRISDWKVPVLTQAFSADPQRALELTAPAFKLYHRQKVKASNLAYHDLVRTRAALLAAIGQNQIAKKEVTTLLSDLRERGVNQPVLKEIRAFRRSL